MKLAATMVLLASISFAQDEYKYDEGFFHYQQYLKQQEADSAKKAQKENKVAKEVQNIYAGISFEDDSADYIQEQLEKAQAQIPVLKKLESKKIDLTSNIKVQAKKIIPLNSNSENPDEISAKIEKTGDKLWLRVGNKASDVSEMSEAQANKAARHLNDIILSASMKRKGVVIEFGDIDIIKSAILNHDEAAIYELAKGDYFLKSRTDMTYGGLINKLKEEFKDSVYAQVLFKHADLLTGALKESKKQNLELLDENDKLENENIALTEENKNLQAELAAYKQQLASVTSIKDNFKKGLNVANRVIKEQKGKLNTCKEGLTEAVVQIDKMEKTWIPKDGLTEKNLEKVFKMKAKNHVKAVRQEARNVAAQK